MEIADGFTAEDYESDPVDVWPDNMRALELFVYLSTQWVMSMSGPCGLNYLVMFHKMDRMGLAPDEYTQLEADIRIMEAAALSKMHEKEPE